LLASLHIEPERALVPASRDPEALSPVLRVLLRVINAQAELTPRRCGGISAAIAPWDFGPIDRRAFYPHRSDPAARAA
jgi:hypothetical protein